MNEASRTLTYVAGAVAALFVAFLFAPSTPKPLSEYAQVGETFFPDFSAVDAKSLEVVSYNEDLTNSKKFKVDFKNGRYVIASHRDYPCDGKDRLAKTAASMIGIKREQFWTSDTEQYADLQVIDPLNEDATKIKGRGQRITLKDGAGKVLCDYIIGKKVSQRDGFYYLRSANERAVYIAQLNVDLSTKFADWIEADLLQLTGETVKQLIGAHPIPDPVTKKLKAEQNILTREKSGDPWKLQGLDETKEDVNQAEINAMITALNDLKILGAREKPEGLSSQLKQSEGLRISESMMRDLALKGFQFTDEGELASREGELVVVTESGVLQILRFGSVFTGTELEMELGLEADQKAREGKTEADKPASGLSKSRYVFITAHFDPSQLGTPPTEPSIPEGLTEEAAQAVAADVKAGKNPVPVPKPGDKPEVAAEVKAKQEYAAALTQYTNDLKSYEEKLKAGEKKSGELNARFADWYFVIADDVFQKLRLKRAALVQAKAPPAVDPNAPKTPETPATPEEQPTEAPATPEEDKPAGDKPTDEKPAEEKPAAETPPEKPAEEQPAEEPAAPSEEKPAEEQPAEEPAAPSEEKPAE